VLAGMVAPGQAVEVLIESVVYGDVAGNSVKSAPFIYPVTLLNNSAGSGVVNLGACSELPSTFIGAKAGGCFPGQDGVVVECCTTGTALICPAQGTGAP